MLSHKNRRGDLYYLHGGKTKTGKPRYFVAKTIGAGALAVMPDGYEFTESINGVVSVRRIDATPSLVPAADVDLALAEVNRHAHLRHHRVEGRKGEIVFYEPVGGISAESLEKVGQLFRWSPSLLESHVEKATARSRYEPVMRFALADPTLPGVYIAYRRYYGGDGGWHYLSRGRLQKLLRAYVASIGTDAFFELM